MRRILYLEHNTDGTVGGSHLCLLEICRHLDRSRYQPVVCFFERNSLWDAFAETGAELMLESELGDGGHGHCGFSFSAACGWSGGGAALLRR